MIKRAIIVSFMLIFSVTNLVFASPLDDVLVEISNMEAEVQKINYEVGTVEDEIECAKEEISNIEREMENNELEIEKLKESIGYKEKEIVDKAKLTYMNTSNPTQQYLEVLLSAKDIKDFAQRLFTIKEIMSSSKEKLDSYNLSKSEIESRQDEIVSQRRELEDMVNSLNSKLEVLVDKREDKESKMLEYQNLKAKYEREIEENEIRIASSLKAIEPVYEVKEDTSNDSISVDSVGTDSSDYDNSNVSNSSLVNIAFKYLGTPYVWGGSSPSGFDCSGFVQYVYREAGINISRTTYTQISEGYAVSDLQPGDLVFFGSYSAPYHVGIYIGSGQYIHAPTEGDVVKVALLQYRGDYCGARRYL